MIILEEDINSYINQFKVDKETAIKNISDATTKYNSQQDKDMEETLNSIIRGMR